MTQRPPRLPPASWMASPIASCAPASPAEDDDGCSSLRIRITSHPSTGGSAAPSSAGNVRPARVRIAQAAQRLPSRSTRSTVRPQRRHCHVIERCSHVSGELPPHDAAEWLPAQNRCWFAARVITVRQRYGLTIDRREADALDQVLAGCVSTELITFAPGAVPAPATPSVRVPEAIAAWDDNRNGRVSCAEARSHGIAPVTRDHPAYPFMRDGDGDGVVCETGSRRASPASPPASPRASGAGCGP